MADIGERLVNFEVFDGVTGRLLGLADVELPTIEALTETVRGAGIAGEVESATLGHISAMSMTLKWRTQEVQGLKLAAQKVHAIELRGAVQRLNTATGVYGVQILKYVTRCTPKSSPLGTLAPSALQEPSAEFSVIYIKVFVDGRSYLEIDPYNYKYVVDGEDYLAAVRSGLGIS